jgi:tetratricopeptide (TPR) repeat protein
MTLQRYGAVLVLFVALGVLPGCESSKDKAARYLASALELIEKGDPQRALVEFRNIFALDPDNREARMAYGALMQSSGNLAEAYVQYQHVSDRNPDDVEALMAGARLAASLERWPEAGKLAAAALALQPDEPAMLGVKVAVEYATAQSAGDLEARRQAAATAQRLLVDQPDSLLLHRIVIDNLLQDASFSQALVAIDTAQALFPDEKVLYLTRLAALSAQNDDAAVLASLQAMVERFPDDVTIGATLLRWYVSKGQLDEAEAFLRARTKTGDLSAGLDMVNFLRQYRSVEAALAEIDALLASQPATAAPAAEAGATATDLPSPATQVTPLLLGVLRANLLYEQGSRDEAIKALQQIVTGAPVSDQVLQYRVMLAQMLLSTGDAVQARALIEAVLTDDPGQTGALKLKGGWLVEDDKTDDAIALLRKALDANPRDPETYTLLAQAYDRAGNRELAGDMLSQAVINSGKAPAESLRYAAFLMVDEKYLPAESLLVDALRLDTENVTILGNLGRLYVLMEDWPRATGVVERLDELATPEATLLSQSLRPAILAGSEKIDSAITYLQDLAGSADASLNAQAALIQAYLANGQEEKALALVDELLAKSPDDLQVVFVAAAVKGATGDSAGAQAGYRAVLEKDPKLESVWTALLRQMVQDQDPTGAEAAVDEALKALPDSVNLQVIKAGFLEQRQDAEGAIAIYSALYDRDTSNQVLANNLASMMSSYRNDPESLEQAYVIARRLRGTTVPAFADTYGWIAHKRGNPTEALPYLEIAAAGLPQDPLVQFHLAETLRALNRAEDARAQYAKVLELVTEDDARDFVKASRQAVEQK